MRRTVGYLASIVSFFASLVLYANGVIIPPPSPPGPRPRPVPQYRPVAVKAVRLNVQIEDQVAKTNVREVFVNPNPRPLEGTFLLPIPPDAQVSDFTFFINGKEVKAEILPRDKALAYYRQIVSRLIDPALLEYAGKGLVRVRLFPIPPHGEAEIRFSYTQVLSSEGGQLTYWYPFGTNKFSSSLLRSAVIDVKIRSKVPLRTIYAPQWSVDIVRKGEHEARVSFEKGDFLPKEDFVLHIGRSEEDFGIMVTAYRTGKEPGFFLLALSPKQELAPGETAPKDIVFVFDTSGSMSGEKIKQAREALSFCINSLRDRDRFNVITFSTTAQAVFPALRPASGENKKEALSFVKDLEAAGGTNIGEALEKALGQEGHTSDRPLMVVFLTDGIPTVGETNWKRILKTVEEKRPEGLRLFVFGVGNDVNTILLDRLAEENGGTRRYVRPGEDIEIKVSQFYMQISRPVLTDVKLTFSLGGVFDLYPPRIHDIFHGQQVILVGRYRKPGPQVLEISGRCGDRNYRHRFPFKLPEKAVEDSYLPRLWAARKVGFLLDQIRLHGEKSELVQEVRRLAKRYGIVTPYTSALVAEEKGIAGLRRLPRVFGRKGETLGVPAAQGVRASGIGAGSARGKAAVEASVALEKLKRVNKAPAVPAFSEDGKAQVQVKVVGAKTFYLRDGVWVDSEYKKGMEEKVVVYLSDQYFDLLGCFPELGRYFAIGKEVVVCLEGTAYRIKPRG